MRYTIACLQQASYTILQSVKEKTEMKYVCELCGWEYDEETGSPDDGIEPGTRFDDLPDDFVCPLCGAGKEDFVKAD